MKLVFFILLVSITACSILNNKKERKLLNYTFRNDIKRKLAR